VEKAWVLIELLPQQLINGLTIGSVLPLTQLGHVARQRARPCDLDRGGRLGRGAQRGAQHEDEGRETPDDT
jgi:hypothetical protein